MDYPWFHSVIPIALLFSFRMLGLFMLIPVFSVAATTLSGATPSLIGIALGVYGLSQGLLQIPFGLLSDKFGRKRLITIGLLLFALGSGLGAYTDSIYGMIIARFLQGAGAIGSVLIALLADLTSDSQRTKAMAIIGVSIGVSFTIAMVISSPITQHFGLSGIFLFTLVLALLGLLLLHAVIANPKKETFHNDSETNLSLMRSVITNTNLLRLDTGILFQHLILTSTFYALPFLLQRLLHLGYLQAQWHFYLPLMISAFILMVPCIVLAERKGYLKAVFLIAVTISALSQLFLTFFAKTFFLLCLFIGGYFVAFNVLEALLPSLISKKAPQQSKGTAMGVYSTCQFLGIFAGGILSGIAYQYGGLSTIFLMNTLLGFLWLSITCFFEL